MESPPSQPQYWRKCTTCKKPIAFSGKYWVCSVSTCNRARTGLVFCSVSCFDAHIPVMNHRDAGAFERRASPEAPTPPKAPAPSTVSGTSAPSAKPRSEKVEKVEKVEEAEEGILVVVSKVKAYIRRRSGMNTSDAVMEVLSRWIRKELDDSIRRAAQADRKTLLDRDIHPGPF